ncbi:hypothetical protein KI387_021473, partial [Taxus chinensis]
MGRRGVNWLKIHQEVRAAVGTIVTSGRVGCEKANCPKVEKIAKFCYRAVWDIWAVGTRGTRTGRKSEGQSIFGGSEKFVPGSLGQLGQKYVEDANRLVRLKEETFVPSSLGHPGQRDAEDTKSRKSRQRMESRHVCSSQTGTRRPESAETRDFRLGQLGQ